MYKGLFVSCAAYMCYDREGQIQGSVHWMVMRGPRYTVIHIAIQFN